MNKCAFTQVNKSMFPSPFGFVQIKLRRRGGESDKIERKCKAEAQMGEKNGKTERDVEQLQQTLASALFWQDSAPFYLFLVYFCLALRHWSLTNDSI